MRARILRAVASRSRATHAIVLALVLVLVLVLTLADLGAAAAGASAAPLESAVTTSSGAWVVLPMGQITNESNTFWQLVHAAPGSSSWSSATPPGVADNGGIVAGTAGGAVLVGILPNGRLRFSPLSLSAGDGASWSALLLPRGLAALPDALAYGTDPVRGDRRALAVTRSAQVIGATGNFASWRTVVTARTLRRVSARCRVVGFDAVALEPSGAPLVATGCAGGGAVGLFASTGGAWRSIGPVLRGSLARASTSMLRLETDGSTVTALISAARGRHRSLVVLWGTSAGWSVSTPFPLPSSARVHATSVESGGSTAVLVRKTRGMLAARITPGGSWLRLPAPPAHTVALAQPATSVSIAAAPLDAFTVSGAVLDVYGLTPSGTRWFKTQSIRVPLAYGSSG